MTLEKTVNHSTLFGTVITSPIPGECGRKRGLSMTQFLAMDS